VDNMTAGCHTIMRIKEQYVMAQWRIILGLKAIYVATECHMLVVLTLIT